MSANVTAEELLFILKLCDKVLIVESDINKLRQILGNLSLQSLYQFVCDLPLNTAKLKEAINKIRFSPKTHTNSQTLSTNKLSILQISAEQQRRQKQYHNLLNSKIPTRH
jgi:hypothetical protein